jgi:hypothetical protein
LLECCGDLPNTFLIFPNDDHTSLAKACLFKQGIDCHRSFPRPKVSFQKFTLTLPACNQQNTIRAILKCFQQIKQIHFSGAWQADGLNLMISLAIPFYFKLFPESVGIQAV